jgi:hypothetical protein
VRQPPAGGQTTEKTCKRRIWPSTGAASDSTTWGSLRPRLRQGVRQRRAAAAESGPAKPLGLITRRSRVRIPPPLSHETPADQAQEPAGPARLPSDQHPALVGAQPTDPHRRHRAQLRDRSLRHRSRAVRARPQLQSARPRQPLRRRHELLPLLQRGEPGADRNGPTRCASATTCSSGLGRPPPRTARPTGDSLGRTPKRSNRTRPSSKFWLQKANPLAANDPP